MNKIAATKWGGGMDWIKSMSATACGSYARRD